MSKVLDSLKAALQIAFGLVILAIILLNFRGLHVALGKFLEQTSVSSIKVLGVEIDMDTAGRALSAADAKRALFHVANLTDAEKRHVLALIHGLDGKEFVRLMYVGQLKNLCEFENPSSEMRDDVALDYDLRDKGLTKIEENPATVESGAPSWPNWLHKERAWTMVTAQLLRHDSHRRWLQRQDGAC